MLDNFDQQNLDNPVTREILGNVDGVSKGIFYLLTLATCFSFAYGIYKRLRLWKQGQPAHRSLSVRLILKRLFLSLIHI